MKLTNYHFKLGVYAISHNIVKAKCTDIQQFNSVKFKGKNSDFKHLD